MTPERLQNILADELAKLEKIPAHLIEQVRRGTHGPNITAAIRAMATAIDEDRAERGTT